MIARSSEVWFQFEGGGVRAWERQTVYGPSGEILTLALLRKSSMHDRWMLENSGHWRGEKFQFYNFIKLLERDCVSPRQFDTIRRNDPFFRWFEPLFIQVRSHDDKAALCGRTMQ